MKPRLYCHRCLLWVATLGSDTTLSVRRHGIKLRESVILCSSCAESGSHHPITRGDSSHGSNEARPEEFRR